MMTTSVAPAQRDDAQPDAAHNKCRYTTARPQTSPATRSTPSSATRFSSKPVAFTCHAVSRTALTFLPPVDIKEMANGVVHPTTNEIMTKYAKIIAVPELREVWLEAMCKELVWLAQGWGTTKGTDTIQFMTHEEIEEIPLDRTVTYARIVCNFCPQKDDPNSVCITVGGNLIDYPL